MRIGVVHFFHESNSFSDDIADEARFRSDCLLTGATVLERWRDTAHEIAGFLDAAVEMRVELCPIIGATTWPCGPVADAVYDLVRDATLDALQRETFDGLLLCLHGAGITESRGDLEGDLLTEIRDATGDGLPMVASLDFHANVSPAIAQTLDAFVGYKTYPHVDYRERGADALRALVRIVNGDIAPQVGYVQPPLLIAPQRQWTSYQPMKPIMARASEMERDERVLFANVFGGFAYGDTERVGFATSVLTDGDAALARDWSSELARMAWERRAAFTPELMSPAEAVAEAKRHDNGLSVLVDIGDNIGGGTPGDGTVLLSEMLRQGVTGAAVILADEEAARLCAEAGVRHEVELSVGGKADDWHGEPMTIKGVAQLVADGEYRNLGPMRDGIVEKQGLTARVSVEGVELILTSRKTPPWNLEQLRSVGIEPTRLRMFVAKSAIAFRAAYEPIAARILEVDTPGLTSANLASFTFERVRRPIYPFDPDLDWSPEA